MIIEIEEEYGYRTWAWTFPGTKEELLAEWKAGRRPVNFWGAREPSTFLGTLVQRRYDDGLDLEYDATAHVHEDDDTFLEIDGVRHWDTPQPNDHRSPG